MKRNLSSNRNISNSSIEKRVHAVNVNIDPSVCVCVCVYAHKLQSTPQRTESFNVELDVATAVRNHFSFCYFIIVRVKLSLSFFLLHVLRKGSFSTARSAIKLIKGSNVIDKCNVFIQISLCVCV